MKNNIIAISVGSVNTSIYRQGFGVVLLEPSVVAVGAGDRRKVKAIGKEAKQLIGKTADATQIIMPISEGEIADERAATQMIESFINKVTLKKLSLRPQVVLSVPCGLDSQAIKKYEKVFNNVGVYNIEFVEAPLLTALGLGAPISEATPCFLIDFGGATTSMAAVSLDGVIAGISVNMGGNTIDAMIIDYIDRVFNLKIGKLTAERVKTEIGSLLEDDVMRAKVNGRDSTTGKPRAVSLGAQDIIVPIRMFFDKIFEIADKFMAKLPVEVSAEIRRSGVYFAGGTSKIVGLAEYFRDVMAIKANVSDEPALATVLGGGIVSSDKALLNKLKIRNR